VFVIRGGDVDFNFNPLNELAFGGVIFSFISVKQGQDGGLLQTVVVRAS
jgi:hypothetical protein